MVKNAAPDTRYDGRLRIDIQNGASIAPPPIPYAVPIMLTKKEVIIKKMEEYS